MLSPQWATTRSFSRKAGLGLLPVGEDTDGEYAATQLADSAILPVMESRAFHHAVPVRDLDEPRRFRPVEVVAW
jgi:hypothetical protein